MASGPQWKPEWKKDTVYLHVLPRQMSKGVPNLSPFGVKLETWLRIHKVPYELVDYMGFSSQTKQSPFILFNEKEIADSNTCIDFLSKYFNIDLYGGLSTEQRAISRSFMKMMEENTCWPIFWYRYVKNMDEYREKGIVFQGPKEGQDAAANGLSKGVEDRASKHGIGRHTDEEIYQIGSDDIRAISGYLGDKKYMFGDMPNLVDCSLFGVIIQITDVDLNFPMKKVIREECQNILDFVERVKSTYWQDWNDQFL